MSRSVSAWLSDRRKSRPSPVDPPLLQLLFVVLLVLALGMGAAAGTVDLTPVTTTAVLALPTVAAVLLLAVRPPGWSVTLLPVLDLVALALLGPGQGLAAGLAVTVPALWLGMRLGRSGVLVTLGVTLAAQTLSLRLWSSGTAGDWLGVLVLTFGAAVVSCAVALTRSHLERALDEVDEVRRRTQNIIDSVDVGLLELDAHGKYRSINAQHERFMSLGEPAGHPRSVGRRSSLFAADGTTPLRDEEVPTARASRGEMLHNELVWVGPDPLTRRGLQVSSMPRHARDGTFAGTVLVFKDVTELIRALRVKDEFVATVSHELRTPLTSIMGYVDVILEDCDGVTPEVRAHLGTVQRNARRLRRLVDDLLSSAHQSVSSSEGREQVSVGALLRLSAREAERSAKEKGLTLEVLTGGGQHDLTVNGDGERLSQVFDNLLSNAIKYTAAGGRVEGELLEEGDEALVRVRDTGRGIAPHELSEIFTSFFRTSDVQSEAIPGVGLGLAITKQIVDAHGGRITAVSELGEGTTFEVRLPLLRSRSAA